MGATKKPASPRQKMINLLYVVLMAMLALNVSSDVLNGFSLVDDSLTRSTSNSHEENKAIYKEFGEHMKSNPTKVKEWYDKAQYVQKISDSLYNYTEELKVAIVKKADGKNGDVNAIRNRENLEAASYVMLAPRNGQGEQLYNAINSFRSRILAMVDSPSQRAAITSNFSTDLSDKSNLLGKNWQEYMFENMPAAAAVTVLTKLQNDIRNAEGGVLHTLISNIDVKDIRVNELNAYVIPNAQTLVQGGRFEAQIIMAAVDTTNRPTIFVGGKELTSDNGIYEAVCNSTGDFTLAGYIETLNGRGESVRRDFTQKYSVVAPAATVSADMMNVMYAGYENPMSISIPGVPVNQISANIAGGNMTQSTPGKYIVQPTEVGQDVVVTVNSTANGRVQQMGQFNFRVRKLPDPMAYMDIKDETGNTVRYKGGSRISKSALLGADGIGAAIDDGLLDINFRVLDFKTTFFDSMGNAVPEVSQGASFSTKQKDTFRSLPRGRQFIISEVRVIGPDGIERMLPGAMQVILN